MLTRETLLRRIESAGYFVYGGRDAMGTEHAPLVIYAEDAEGHVTRVSVDTAGAEGEFEALERMAEALGMSPDKEVPLDD